MRGLGGVRVRVGRLERVDPTRQGGQNEWRD